MTCIYRHVHIDFIYNKEVTKYLNSIITMFSNEAALDFTFLFARYQNLPGKLGQQSAICWNSLGLFRDFFFRNKTFFSASVWKRISWNVEKFQLIQLIQLSDWVEILWGFTKFFFKQMLKISAFYLVKQKSFIPKKIWLRL